MIEMAPRIASGPTPPEDPGQGLMRPWPDLVIAALVLAGLASPLIPLSGAAAAFALADHDQGTMLAGAGLMHVILGMTLLAGI